MLELPASPAQGVTCQGQGSKVRLFYFPDDQKPARPLCHLILSLSQPRAPYSRRRWSWGAGGAAMERHSESRSVTERTQKRCILFLTSREHLVNSTFQITPVTVSVGPAGPTVLTFTQHLRPSSPEGPTESLRQHPVTVLLRAVSSGKMPSTYLLSSPPPRHP